MGQVPWGPLCVRADGAVFMGRAPLWLLLVSLAILCPPVALMRGFGSSPPRTHPSALAFPGECQVTAPCTVAGGHPEVPELSAVSQN